MPIHARLVGMGETGVADNADPSTIYYNPANAVGAPRAYLTGSRMNWPDDWIADDMWSGRANAGVAWQGSAAGSLNWGADFSLAKLDYGESIVTLPDGTPLGTVRSFEKVASLAFAVAIPAGSRYELRAGVAAKRWWAEYAPAEVPSGGDISESASTYAFDAGLVGAMRADVNDWTVSPALAVALVDAGPDIDEWNDPLPTRLNFGANLSVESPPHRLGDAEVPLVAIAANVDAMHAFHGRSGWGMGMEAALAQILFLRTGAHVVDADDEGDDEIFSGWSVGVGLPLSGFRLRADYTRSDYYFSTSDEHFGVTLAWVF
ncbi:MAG TPA: hypothetical protein VF247_09770 [Candidatus Krumholzibacteria bacterium]